MNINPDKVKELVLLFSELDDDYQKELMGKAYELSLKQTQKNLIKKEGKRFKNDEEYKNEIKKRSRERAKESLDLLQIFDKVGDEEKAQLAIVLNKLSHGNLTQKTDIEIKINSTCELKVCTTKKPENPSVFLTLPVAHELSVLCMI